MKATTRLCPIVLLICAARVVCTAQQRYYNSNNAIGYPLGYAETKLLQNEYLPEKRNKPSLSIVNPLDVLRQRLLLEIARRQMKENTRQVELNRAIMKNVGKRTRTNGEHYYNYKFPTQTSQQQWEYLLTHTPHAQYQKTYTFNTPQQLQKQQQLLQLQLQEQLSQQPHHYVNQFEYIPDVSDYDYQQQPLYIFDVGGSESGQPETIKHTFSYINALESVADDGDLNTYKGNENEILNETTNENNKKTNSNSATERRNHGTNEAGSTNKNLADNEQRLGGVMQELEGNNANTDTQLRYLYGLHNKRRNM